MSNHEAILLGERASACREVIGEAFVALRAAMVREMLLMPNSKDSEDEVINMHKSISLLSGLEAAIDNFIITGSVESSIRQAQSSENQGD